MKKGGQSLILVSNPGSSSRKYALYDSDAKERARIHFEMDEHNKVACTVNREGASHPVDISIDKLSDAASHVEKVLKDEGVLTDDDTIGGVGLRIVAPSAYFMQDHVVDDEVVTKLEAARDLAPIHIEGTLHELQYLRQQFPKTPIVGVSDSAFHAAKPSYAWNYGIDLNDADRLDIKRFGYHGISVTASVDALWNAGKLPPKVIVCHLGSGSSITGVFHGRSIDNTMGFTPLEGLVMATRSGTIDFGAVRALKKGLDLDDDKLEDYLHHHGGLLGLAGSDDIRQLIQREADGDHRAHLALTTLVHSIHKGIGQMLVAMNGCDLLIFTGTVGERSAILRKRIVAHLEFYDFIIDGNENDACTSPEKMTSIAQATKSRPIIVIPTDESLEIARRVRKNLPVL